MTERISAPMSRAAALRGGAVAALVLLAGGAVYEWQPDRAARDDYRYRVLDDGERAILASIAPVMLAGALPADPVAHAAALSATIRGFDTAVAGLPPAVQAEVAQLFAILRFPLARLLATGIAQPWHAAPPERVARFLQSWRSGPIVTLRGAYDALHQLVFAAWYGNEASWARIGYPGPPLLHRAR